VDNFSKESFIAGSKFSKMALFDVFYYLYFSLAFNYKNFKYKIQTPYWSNFPERLQQEKRRTFFQICS